MSIHPSPSAPRPLHLHLVPTPAAAAPAPERVGILAALIDRLLRLRVGAETRLVAVHRRFDERGQSTAEYALVLLGAATVALMLVAWAGRTDKIGALLDGVLDSILSRLS